MGELGTPSWINPEDARPRSNETEPTLRRHARACPGHDSGERVQLIGNSVYRSIRTAGSVSPMLSRRDVLLGSGCALATFAARARAERAPDGFTVLRASTAGFDGAVPGPVIRARRGGEVKVRLVNGLDEPTALHWHGVRLPNAMDGGSPLTGPPVAPGASFDYRFAAPDAGTFWYRAL